MGEIHINVWRENIEEGMKITFKRKGICKQNGKPRYELNMRNNVGGEISFWTCDPKLLSMFFASCVGIIRTYQEKN